MAFASTVTVDEIESLEMASFPGEITVVSSGKCEEFDQAMAYLGAQEDRKSTRLNSSHA